VEFLKIIATTLVGYALYSVAFFILLGIWIFSGFRSIKQIENAVNDNDPIRLRSLSKASHKNKLS